MTSNIKGGIASDASSTSSAALLVPAAMWRRHSDAFCLQSPAQPIVNRTGKD